MSERFPRTPGSEHEWLAAFYDHREGTCSAARRNCSHTAT